MRWWGGERWSDEFLKTRSESGGSGTPASPKPSPRSGGAPWWAWVVAMIVVFQPELRRALAWIGQGPVLERLLGGSAERAQVVDELVRASDSLAGRRIDPPIEFVKYQDGEFEVLEARN